MPAEEPSVWLGLRLNSRRNQVNDTFAREINAEMRTVLQAITAGVKNGGYRTPRTVRSSLTRTPRQVTTAAADIGVSLLLRP